METLYRARNWFASAPSFFVLLIAIALTAMHTPKPVRQKADTTPMRVSIAVPPETPPAPPPPPELTPMPEVTPDIALPAMPKLTPRATPKPTPQAAPAPAVQPQEQAVASAAPQPVAAPRPAPAAPAAASQDDAYSAQVKAYLEGIKHYPTSKEARLQRPRGVVSVWIMIDRSGAMKEAGIEESSGSLILDGAALSTVRNAAYPPFPASAFNGQPAHRFTVQLNYTMN